MKLHIGCGANLKEGWDNIDGNTKEEIATRYKMSLDEREKFLQSDIPIIKASIFDLPYESDSVDEILAEGFIEHLSFADEGKFWNEVRRVLKPGGTVSVNAPDFDKQCQLWLEAKDEFLGFWKEDAAEDWFGQGDRNITSKWGYLLATFFGNQSSEFQYHKTAYTKKKFEGICKLLNFSAIEIRDDGQWRKKFEPMIIMKARKN